MSTDPIQYMEPQEENLLIILISTVSALLNGEHLADVESSEYSS